MRRVIAIFALSSALLSTPVFAQPIPEDQLCLTPAGIGAMEDGKCRPLPGDKREIKPEQLPLHLRNDFRLRLRVISDDKPDEDYNLSSLHKNDTVTELDLYREGPIDLSTLPSMTALRALSLSIDAAKALDQLATPPATVRDLRLYAPRDVLDLAALAGWTDLRVLNVTALGVTGQEALANLPNLQHVHFDLGQETDLSALASASKLEVLYVRGSLGRTVFSDLSFVASLTKLEILSLHTNAITDIAPLAGLTALRTLVLSGNKGITDISVLRNMSGLKNLQLRETGVTDLSVLRDMKDLQILWLDRTPVSDLSPLADTTALWGLELSRTQVTDLSPLKGLPIKHLNLFKTPVSDISVVRDMPLQSLNLIGSQVTDYSAIPPKTSVRK